tara:strand:- start:125 stop:1198 length:1074 start_codon:yes stop_codon:yes gene_type:complete
MDQSCLICDPNLDALTSSISDIKNKANALTADSTKGISSKIVEMQSAMSSKLVNIQTQIELAIPAIPPSVNNMRSDLDELINNFNLTSVTSFETQFGNHLDGIFSSAGVNDVQGLMGQISSGGLNLCSDIPNIDVNEAGDSVIKGQPAILSEEDPIALPDPPAAKEDINVVPVPAVKVEEQKTEEETVDVYEKPLVLPAPPATVPAEDLESTTATESDLLGSEAKPKKPVSKPIPPTKLVYEPLFKEDLVWAPWEDYIRSISRWTPGGHRTEINYVRSWKKYALERRNSLTNIIARRKAKGKSYAKSAAKLAELETIIANGPVTLKGDIVPYTDTGPAWQSGTMPVETTGEYPNGDI